MKRLIAFFLIISILFPSYTALAMTSAEKESAYNAAFLQLETYLESLQDNSIELNSIANTFEELILFSK